MFVPVQSQDVLVSVTFKYMVKMCGFLSHSGTWSRCVGFCNVPVHGQDVWVLVMFRYMVKMCGF